MNQRLNTPSVEPLALDVLEGLNASPKRLPSHWFYDDAGSALFEQIMALPEYYLTRAEHRLLATQGGAIASALVDGAGGAQGVQLVELGSGNGEKTLRLCQALQAQQLPWCYVPIDLSLAALAQLQQRFAAAMPHADVNPLSGDFRLHWPAHTPGLRQVVLFMGSNLGNLDADESLELLIQLRERLRPGDRLLLGLDLQKDPRRILQAYSDAQGLTARFNLNLLTRMNRELGMDFDIERFAHYASYSPLDGAARSFLVSQRHQTVRSRVLDRHFEFGDGEAIYTEQSQKYTPQSVSSLLQAAGFELLHQFDEPQDAYAVFLGAVPPNAAVCS